MNNVIEMAKNHLVLSMQDILDTDMMEHSIKDFMELCLHDHFDNKSVIVHGETEIVVTPVDNTNTNIKIIHNNASVTLFRYGRGNVYALSQKYWKEFRNTFHDEYPDEGYVDEVIFALVETLTENHFLYLM